MNNIEKKEILKHKKILLGTIAMLLVFLSIVIAVSLQNIFTFSKNGMRQTPETGAGQVVFNQPILTIFGDRGILNAFPDTIKIHLPYILIVSPEDSLQTAVVYTSQTGKIIKTYNTILLDYFQGNILYNKNGSETFYNQTDLGLHCDEGVITSNNKVACVTEKTTDPLDNKLISIDVKTGQRHDLYNSQDLLQSVNVVNGTLYIGATNIASGKNYLIIATNGFTKILARTPVDVVYTMQGNLYYATFRRPTLNEEARYYQIIKDSTGIAFKIQGTTKLLLYRE